MGLIKRVCRALTGHKVKVTGDITFSIGKFKPVDKILVASGGYKTTQLAHVLHDQEDQVLYFLHVEVDSCYNLGSSDAMGLSDPFVVLYLNGVEFGRTTVKDNTSRPYWEDEAFEIPVYERLGVPCLTLAVYDMDSDGVGDFLGNAIYNMNEDVLGLKLQNEKDMLIRTATMDLQPTKNIFTKPPSMFESPTVAMHMTSPADRETSRKSSRNRDSNARIKEAVQDVEDSSELIIISFLIIAAYLAITYWVFVYLLEEKFTALDSIYFAVVTFTTVGYGDMGPTSNAGKIFSIFHALCGVMMIGSGFSILLKQVVQRELQAVELAQKKTSEFLVGSVLSDDDDTGDESEDKPNDEELLDISTKKGVEIAKAKIAGVAKDNSTANGDESATNAHQVANRSFNNLLIIWFLAITFLCIGGVSMGYLENWSGLDSVYWVMITATSVGYGDFSPSSDWGKVVACVFLPFSVGLMSASIGQTVNYFLERRAIGQSEALFMTDFALDDFMHINAKDTNKISRSEYLAFLLIMMKKVDQSLIDKLNLQFDQLDADSNGYLEPVDLKIIKNKKTDVRRAAVSRFHGKNEYFKLHRYGNPSVPGTNAMLSTRAKGVSLRRRISDGDLEIGGGHATADLSPPHKDAEEGLYFFDAAEDRSVLTYGNRL